MRVTELLEARAKPSSKYSKAELARIAEKVGHQLFDKHRSGLIWGGKPTIKFLNLSDRLRQLVKDVGEDALRFEDFQPFEFEFVMFPSKEKGRDVSTLLNLVSDQDKMKDDDGLMYLVDNTDETLIQVLAPDIANEKEYLDVVNSALKPKSQSKSKIDLKKFMAWQREVHKKYPEATFEKKPDRNGLMFAFQGDGQHAGWYYVIAPNDLVAANSGAVYPKRKA